MSDGKLPKLPRPLHWVEESGALVPVDDVLEWARWWERADRRVALTELTDPRFSEPIWISTVFLGLDHNFSLHGPPLLYETMIFGLDADDEHQWRYPERWAAYLGHQRAVAFVKRELAALPAL